MNSSKTRSLAVSGLVIAADVVLTRLLAVNTPIMKISLGFFAVAVCAALYGPAHAAICAALSDLLGSLLFPVGAYFPGFTVTAAVTGLIFGFFLRNYSKRRAVLAAAVNSVLVSYLANTGMLSFLTGSPYPQLLGTRAIQLAVMLPLQIAMLVFALPSVLRRLR